MSRWDWKMEDKKVLQKARTLFNRLKIDPVSVLFSEELLDKRLLKKKSMQKTPNWRKKSGILGKNATFPQYVLVIVDLYSSKVYTYTRKSRKQILQKMKLFYDEVRSKRKGNRMRLQVDSEFQQAKIKDLNDENNVEMFTSSVRSGKAFAAEQKIRELETRVSKLNAQKLKISPLKQSKIQHLTWTSWRV